jgi:hypothetical protein
MKKIDTYWQNIQIAINATKRMHVQIPREISSCDLVLEPIEHIQQLRIPLLHQIPIILIVPDDVYPPRVQRPPVVLRVPQIMQRVARCVVRLPRLVDDAGAVARVVDFPGYEVRGGHDARAGFEEPLRFAGCILDPGLGGGQVGEVDALGARQAFRVGVLDAEYVPSSRSYTAAWTVDVGVPMPYPVRPVYEEHDDEEVEKVARAIF